MLNELPKKKKEKNYSDPNGWQLFWRVVKECARRAVTPYLMYLFMSLTCLVCQIPESLATRVTLGIICILVGAFFNAHLLWNYGKLHYGAFVAGELHRRNKLFGVESGGDHRPEREYRFWKGFLIGFFIGVPVLILGVIAGSIPSTKLVAEGGGFAYYFFVMFAGWAIIPITWFGTTPGLGLAVSVYYSILFVLLPVVVSGIAYIAGAFREKMQREREAEREQAVIEAGKAAREKINTGKKK